MIINKASLSPEDNSQRARLIAAARSGDTKTCMQLIDEGCHIETTMPENGCTAFLCAVQRGKVETAMAFLDRGANILAKSDDDYQALHFAFYWSPDDFEKLISRGANVNALSIANTTPLMSMHEVDHMRILLQSGADPNIVAKNGTTALTNTAWNGGNFEKIKVLIKFGADPNHENSYFLDRGQRTSALRRCMKTNDVKTATLLLSLGASPIKANHCHNNAWRTLMSLPPLHAAATGGHTDVAIDLMDKGCDPLAKHRRKTPARWAALGQYFDTAAAIDARIAMNSIRDLLKNEAVLTAPSCQ